MGVETVAKLDTTYTNGSLADLFLACIPLLISVSLASTVGPCFRAVILWV